MTANLNRRDDGRCLWQGEILHELDGGDPYDSAYHFMSILAAAVGRPAQNQAVESPE